MPRVVVRTACACLLILGASVPARAEPRISWYTDLGRAAVAAQKADLPMFIDFWAEWCAPCIAMDREVYTDRSVIQAFGRGVIGVRLHFDRHRDTARAYGVTGLPHLVVAASSGMPLMFHQGFMSARDLTAVLRAIPPLAEINRIDRRLRQDRNSFADLVAMARALRDAGFLESSAGYYDRASRHSAAGSDAPLRQTLCHEGGLALLALRDGARAAVMLERGAKGAPRSSRTAEMLLAIARAYGIAGRPDRARAALQSLVTDYPDSAAARQARALAGRR